MHLRPASERRVTPGPPLSRRGRLGSELAGENLIRTCQRRARHCKTPSSEQERRGLTTQTGPEPVRHGPSDEPGRPHDPGRPPSWALPRLTTSGPGPGPGSGPTRARAAVSRQTPVRGDARPGSGRNAPEASARARGDALGAPALLCGPRSLPHSLQLSFHSLLSLSLSLSLALTVSLSPSVSEPRTALRKTSHRPSSTSDNMAVGASPRPGPGGTMIQAPGRPEHRL